MGKSFREVFDEISSNITLSKSGKRIKSFSKTDFDKLAKAFLNETGYKTETASLKEGQLVTKEVMPVQEFRKMIQKILVDFGVDKAAAAGVLDNYEIHNVDGMYEVCSEVIYQYMSAGKKFEFMTKPDFKGSLTLDEVEQKTTTHKRIKKNPGDPDLGDITVTKKAHKELGKKSKTPSWLKLKDDGKGKKK